MLFPWLYDRFMSKAEAHGLGAWRKELLADVEGRVLEPGAGTGANLAHYPAGVRLTLTEPNRLMRARLSERVSALGLDAAVSDAAIERLPFDDASFDVVVSTLLLCSVNDLAGALAEIHRVLRPGGRLLFLEHVASERGGRYLWQRRLEPCWSWFADGCRLTRRTAEAIEAAGFEIESCVRESMRKALPIVRPTVRGVALRVETAPGRAKRGA